jgi:hypothetical protein
MLPVDFPERNKVFTKPDGMTDEECSDLPVWKGKSTDGIPLIISKWKLSKEDIEEINRTGELWLKIVGDTQPPVELTTEYPFIK